MTLLVPTYSSPGWQCHQISPFHSSTLPSAKCQVPSAKCQVKLPVWHHTSQGQLLSVCLASWCLWNMVIYSFIVQAPSKLQIWDFMFLCAKSLPHKNLEMPLQTSRVLDLFFHSVKMWCRQTSKPKTPSPTPKLQGTHYLILEKIEPLIFSLPHLRTKSLEYFFSKCLTF